VQYQGHPKSSAKRPGRVWDAQSISWHGCIGFFWPGVKRPEREAGHSHRTSAEVKNALFTQSYGSVFN
jgi:hypothetical protein